MVQSHLFKAECPQWVESLFRQNRLLQDSELDDLKAPFSAAIVMLP